MIGRKVDSEIASTDNEPERRISSGHVEARRIASPISNLCAAVLVTSYVQRIELRRELGPSDLLWYCGCTMRPFGQSGCPRDSYPQRSSSSLPVDARTEHDRVNDHPPPRTNRIFEISPSPLAIYFDYPTAAYFHRLGIAFRESVAIRILVSFDFSLDPSYLANTRPSILPTALTPDGLCEPAEGEAEL